MWCVSAFPPEFQSGYFQREHKVSKARPNVGPLSQIMRNADYRSRTSAVPLYAPVYARVHTTQVCRRPREENFSLTVTSFLPSFLNFERLSASIASLTCATWAFWNRGRPREPSGICNVTVFPLDLSHNSINGLSTIFGLHQGFYTIKHCHFDLPVRTRFGGWSIALMYLSSNVADKD